MERATGGIAIRELREDDDFEAIRVLINDTMRRASPNVSIHYGGTAEMVRKNYADRRNKAFIAEEDGRMKGFIGSMGPYGDRGIAALEFGFAEGCDGLLEGLLARCADDVRERGGGRLKLRSYPEFGQIRNPWITMLERYGFVADPYLETSINIDLSKWEAPEPFDSGGIEPAGPADREAIVRMLDEDGEDGLVRTIGYAGGVHPNYKGHSPDHVLLILKPDESAETAAIAYYKVVVFEKEGKEKILALSFFVHFRPGGKVSRAEKRRFLQAAYRSMRQLGVTRAMATMTFRDFETFAAVLAEGYYHISAPTHAVTMTKQL